MRCLFSGMIIGLFAMNASAQGLDLRQGTRAFGGSASVTLNTTTDVHALRIAPAFGYFVADNVEFTLTFQYSNNLGEESGSLIGGGIGLLGYLDAGAVYLKSGVVFAGYGSFFNGQSETLLELVVPFLLVVPLSSSLAVNTGLMVQVFFSPDGGEPMVQLPMGFLGVSGYY